MRISFDLDETLFVNPEKNETERLPGLLFCVFYRDRLRSGTVDLFKELKKNNIEIFIYTTSFRSIGYIKGFFKSYRIQPDGIINGAKHDETVQRGKKEIMPSKYPSKFRIDLHVDDDITVKQNGDIYGFKVLIISPDDKEWTDKIRKAAGI